MHPSTDINKIKKALSDLGHEVTNIWNIKQRETKKPLPFLIVELKQNENNKLIYETKSLLHCRVIIEPPRPKRELPQCANCQQYGHTKTYCRRSPKCIKCAGNHNSADCTKKGRSDDVKCILCEGDHPANYKGCKIYRELQAKKSPPIRRKVLVTETRNSRVTEAKTNQATDSKYTYAHVMYNKSNSLELNNEHVLTNNGIEDPNEINNILKQILQHLTTMTNLLLSFMSKMTNSTP